MKKKRHHIILFLMLIFLIKSQAQIFIPLSYWKGLSPMTTNPPSTIYLVVDDVIPITVSGGMGVYTWSNTGAAQADNASITSYSVLPDRTSPTAEYVARSTAYTTDTITITSGTTTPKTVSVVTYNSLAISPVTITMAVSTNQNFTATGGCLTATPCNGGGAYVFSVVSGGGSITSPGGVFTAPAAPGTTVVQVADLIGNTATATITSVNVLTISPSTLKIPVFSTNAFSSILGTPAYTYSVIPGTGGTGTVVAGTGVYTAPSTVGTNTVRVTDVPLATSDSAVTIIKPVDIQVGQYFACALYNEGSVKCWGANVYGQLGTGATSTIGDGAAEIGGANPFVDLGTGRTATQIAVGNDHVCALLDDATVKCWGRGLYGQLGKGNPSNLGNTALEMGDNLTPINLGTGRTATAVYAFSNISCAKLDDLSVKCWGRNDRGQMGIGNIAGNNSALGDDVNEMGDNLAPIDFGTGRTAVKLTGGINHICALLDNATVKCWGRNDRGQLGKNNTTSLGDNVNEMGDFLTAVNIDGNSGGARTATDIISGTDHNCVIRDNATMICWGRNSNGQLGNGNTNTIGDGAGEMANISSINMGAGFATLTNIYGAGRTSCAKDNANMFKCWGRNGEGQLLLGNTTDATAPPAAALNIGAGLVISKLMTQRYVLCSLFTNDRIKCWGLGTDAGGTNAHGVFISTSAANLGDNGGETGAGLNYINH